MKFSLTQGYRRPDGILSAFANDQRKEAVMDERSKENNGAWLHLEEPFQEISALRDEMLRMENSFREHTGSLADAHRDGAKNLLHYLALRRHDIRPLQEKLALFGLSSLG